MGALHYTGWSELDMKVLAGITATFPDFRDERDKIPSLSPTIKTAIANLIESPEGGADFIVSEAAREKINAIYTRHLQLLPEEV